MINQEFILLIMNCKKYKEKAQFQKNTWLKNIPSYLKYYHVIGDETIDNEYIFDEINHILWVKTADDYNSLPKKVIYSYQAINERYDFKYIFKTDDDQMLLNPKFFDILPRIILSRIKNKQPKIHYGGFIVNIKQPQLSQYHKIHPELPENLPLYSTKYCSGRFYFLSNDAIKNLLSKKELIEKEYFEDYAIGYNLDSFYKENMLPLSTNDYFKDSNF